MNKYIVSVLIIILFGATFLQLGKGESIKFNPELNKTYRYEAQVLLNTDKNEDYPIGYVQMMMKIDYAITFINSDLDFYLEIEGIKGFMKPSLIRHSSESSRTKYFNTYDSVQHDKKQIAFKKLFQGKRFLISSDEGISMDDGNNDPGLDALREEGILEPLIRDFRSKNLNSFSNISIEKGNSFKVIDSVLVKNSKYLKMNNQFVVKDITRNKVQLTSTGQARFKSNDIILAQRMTLNRKTGLPKVAHQYLQLGSENEIFSLVKMKEVDAPNILQEFEVLNNTRLYNVINVDRKKSDIGNIPPLHAKPFKSYTKDEYRQKVDQYLDSLILVEDELNRSMFVYSGIQVYSRQPLHGAYVKAALLRTISKEGDTLSLKSHFKSDSHFSLSPIGPYQVDMFQRQPQVESCSLDLTVMVATETEEITLTNKRKKQAEFELNLNDSTVTLSYQHDGIRLFSPYPMHSLKCYDKEGNEVQARLVGIEPNGLHKSGRYTALELAEIYADQDLTDPHKAVSYIFEAPNVDHVVLEAYTDIVPFNGTLSTP